MHATHRVGRGETWRRRSARALWALIAVAALSAGSPSADQEAAMIGGAFTLVDQDGRTVTEATYYGRWLLLYFGYTHCPDACPMALGTIVEALDLLDATERARLQPIFVTVDPERDTPAVMKAYVAAFQGGGIVGLSGSQAQVAAIEAAYRISVQRRAGPDGDYSVDHPAFIHIVDPSGHFVGLISDMLPPERLAGRLRSLVDP